MRREQPDYLMLKHRSYYNTYAHIQQTTVAAARNTQYAHRLFVLRVGFAEGGFLGLLFFVVGYLLFLVVLLFAGLLFVGLL